MQKIRYGLIVLGILLCLATPTAAQVSISFSSPHVSIGINLPLYPELVLVPGYPVYYAPRLSANYFFYDGVYWVYQDDYWYTSDWYNGPWWQVEPEFVPVFILRIPVRYYRRPPVYFSGWAANAPPRWDRHWGRDWEERRRGWDRWDRRSVPAPAPRPDYQRRYSGDRYPRGEQQRNLHQQLYRYQPRDTMIRERIQPRMERRTPAPPPRKKSQEPQQRSQRQQDDRRETPRQQVAPDARRAQPPPQSSPRQPGSAVRKLEQQPGTVQQRERKQQQQPGTVKQIEREQQKPRPQGQGQGQRQEQIQGQGQRQEQMQGQGQRQEQMQGQGQVKRQKKGQKKDQDQEEKDQEQEEGKDQERGRR
jgi:hypothetical protein